MRAAENSTFFLESEFPTNRCQTPLNTAPPAAYAPVSGALSKSGLAGGLQAPLHDVCRVAPCSTVYRGEAPCGAGEAGSPFVVAEFFRVLGEAKFYSAIVV